MTDRNVEFSSGAEALNFVEPFETGLGMLTGLKADQLRTGYHKGVLAYLDLPEAAYDMTSSEDVQTYVAFLGGLGDFKDEFGMDEKGVIVANAIVSSVDEARKAGKTDDEIREFSLIRIEQDELKKRLADLGVSYQPNEAAPDTDEAPVGRRNRAREVIAPLAAIAVLVGGIAVSGVLAGKRSRTAQAQAVAQNFATRIDNVALEDAGNARDKVTESVDPNYTEVTELTVKDPDYDLTVDYTNTSGITTAPQNVASVEIDYFPKSHSDNNVQYDFSLFNKTESGFPGWSMYKYGSFAGPTANQSGASSTNNPTISEYNTAVKTPQVQRHDLGLVLVPLTSKKFAALKGEANKVLHAIETDANLQADANQ